MAPISQDESDPTDSIWMTKAELAAIRRISVASTDRLIRRHGWRKQPGNDGRIRVLVPRTWVESQSIDPADKLVLEPSETVISAADIRGTLSALRAVITILQEQHQAERGFWHEDRTRLLEEITGLRIERDQAVAELRTERDRGTAERERTQTLLERVEQDRKAERLRADELYEQVMALQHATTEATAVVELAIRAVQMARQQEAIRRPAGLLQWLRAAWWGR